MIEYENRRDQLEADIEQTEIEILREALQTPGLPTYYIDAVNHRIAWLKTARPEQLQPDGEYDTWLYLGGRGAGKTRTAAETLFWYAIKHPGVRIGIVAPTLGDLEKICFTGQSGLLGVGGEGNSPLRPNNGVVPKSCIDKYTSSNYYLRLVNGSTFQGFAAEAQERLRGNQFHILWFEEMGAWVNMQETIDQAQFCLRLHEDENGNKTESRMIVSTTPRPVKPLIKMMKSPTTVVTRGSSFDNAANLDAKAIRRFKLMEKTVIGRQEIHAEILDMSDSVPIKRSMWQPWSQQLPALEKIVISADTAMKPGKQHDSSACTVWAVARINKAFYTKHSDMGFQVRKTKKEWAIILIEAWREKLAYVDLKPRLLETYNKYRDILEDAGDEDERPDLDLLIEDKQSGTNLISEFSAADMNVIPFNPMVAGREKHQKRMRADMASEAFVQDRVYAMGRRMGPDTVIFNGSQHFDPELDFDDQSEKWRNSVDGVIEQCNGFTGVDSGENDVDDYVDTVSQVILYLRDEGYIDIDTDVTYHLNNSREEEAALANDQKPLESLYG